MSIFADPRERALDSRSRQPDGLVALVTAVRWGTTTVGLLWAAALGEDGHVLGLGVMLLAYSLWRTFRPIEYRRRGWRSRVSILSELAITLAIVVASGCWNSPYIFTLFTPVIAAGFARGFGHALRIAVTSAITVALAASLLDLDTGIRPVTSWAGELLLVAGVASYGRRILMRAEQVRALNLSQVWRLNEANALLVSLNKLAHDLPVSFDFHETLSNALSRVREATQPDLSALLLLDPVSPDWIVAMSEGIKLPEVVPEGQFPFDVARVAHAHTAELITSFDGERHGFDVKSQSAIYLPLWTGTKQVGLLIVEAHGVKHFGQEELHLLQELSEPIALTIDNARWFERLRARGAAQERTRIARDLHDRIGQSMAYVAFELDRLAGLASGTSLEDDLGRLRSDARAMVKELRETLYDLRADVSDEHGFGETAQEFLARVQARSDLSTSLTVNATRRLPLAQEREVWRICQEAIVNAERHANATTIDVKWDLDDHGGLLEIRDNGVGLTNPSTQDHGLVGYGESGSPGRPSYGLTGMHERADVIGASLEVTARETGSGTVVRLQLGDRRVNEIKASSQLTSGDEDG